MDRNQVSTVVLMGGCRGDLFECKSYFHLEFSNIYYLACKSYFHLEFNNIYYLACSVIHYHCSWLSLFALLVDNGYSLVAYYCDQPWWFVLMPSCKWLLFFSRILDSWAPNLYLLHTKWYCSVFKHQYSKSNLTLCETLLWDVKIWDKNGKLF